MKGNLGKATMYQKEATICMQNKVPGFDPLKYARWEVDESGQKKPTLDLNCKLMWFRLRHRAGSCPVRFLRIDGEEAVAEATVSFTRGGPVVSSAQVRRTVHEPCGAKYIEEARRAALDQALTDAGFDIQSNARDSVMLTHGSGLTQGAAEPAAGGCIGVDLTKVPADKDTITVQAVKQQMASEAVAESSSDADVEEAPMPLEAAAQPVEQQDTSEAAAEPSSGAELMGTPASEEAVAQPVEKQEMEGAAVGTELPEAPAADSHVAVAVAGGEDHNTVSVTDEAKTEKMVQLEALYTEGPTEEDVSVSAGRFAKEMSVDEILAQITMEEALAVRIDVGSSEGQTISMVLERRPATIKWLANGYTGDNNILRAAARYVLESGTVAKAG